MVAVAVGNWAATIVGLGLAVALAGAVAANLIVTERRRHEAAEEELTSEARFLESLVETMGSIAGDADVLERTRERLSGCSRRAHSCSSPASVRNTRPPRTRSSFRCVHATMRSVPCG